MRNGYECINNSHHNIDFLSSIGSGSCDGGGLEKPVPLWPPRVESGPGLTSILTVRRFHMEADQGHMWKIDIFNFRILWSACFIIMFYIYCNGVSFHFSVKSSYSRRLCAFCEASVSVSIRWNSVRQEVWTSARIYNQVVKVWGRLWPLTASWRLHIRLLWFVRSH